MCGIAGYIGSQPPDNRAVAACHALMGRRGPDATGAWRHRARPGREVVLLHSRLSIIDLDPRANQPMHADGHALAINGELYNYVELGAALRAAGLSFTTTSDSEVLLRLLARDGLDALDRCEGMWAFAFYDEAKGTLVLSRDRFGEKPLWLHRAPHGLYFASEPKFIAALASRRFSPNERQLMRYLVTGYRTLYKTGDTFFEGIEELPAGQLLIDDGAGPARTRSYWTPALGENDGLTFADSVAKARAALIDAVRLRMRADVPLAFCMSGGVDSNTLISIARNVLNCDVHGFTIVNRDARYTEQEMVDHAVAAQGLQHTAIPLSTADFLPRLTRLVDYHDAPLFTITAYVHWLLMEAMHERGYRIAISGTGADEIFSGYYDHHLAYLADVRRDPARHTSALAEWQHHVLPHILNPLLRDPDLFVNNPGDRRHVTSGSDVFAAAMVKPWTEAFTERHWVDATLRNRMLNEIFVETIPPPLHEEDANAMYWSIENRSPFLDRNLFEACATIPVRHLVKDGMAKAVLREAMRGIVPAEILDNRRKVGFNAPIRDLLDVRDRNVRAAVLDDGSVFDLVRRDAIESLLDAPELDNAQSMFVFRFLNARLFLERFGAGVDRARVVAEASA
jgi:asparagine synthase (glutamine-hydrolysing)